MQQSSVYLEKNDTLYQAVNRMEQVGNDLILFSVIMDSNQKLFKPIELDM